MQVVEGCPFVPFPTPPTSRKPERPWVCHCALVQLVASSTVLICMFSRMMSEVGCAAPSSPTVTSACLLLFVAQRLCTLMPLNTHLLVERMYRVENTGVCPGAALTVTKSELGIWVL